MSETDNNNGEGQDQPGQAPLEQAQPVEAQPEEALPEPIPFPVRGHAGPVPEEPQVPEPIPTHATAPRELSARISASRSASRPTPPIPISPPMPLHSMCGRSGGIVSA